ncbi:endonuclease G, mitochondrial-like [Elysia marginata]|uniref:Endonuclease n=1 Tax=Elysia marginata TaxID=1093978 RepID=A0AAV4I9P5_9GAST|nr:endonuclease G, mitochondrial-like [Elysia marginata]
MKAFKRLFTTAAIGTSCLGIGFFFGRKVPIETDKLSFSIFSGPHQQTSDHRCQSSPFSKSALWPLLTLRAATPFTTPTESPASSVQQPANAVQNMVRYGFPSMDNLRSYEDFMLSYDRRTRVPNWVLEHLTPEKVTVKEGVERSKMQFVEDGSVHAYHRATNKDYAGSGYDRGHMAAAANHRQSENAMKQTFTLSNVAPQVGQGFNRDAWNNLEKYVRALARKNRNIYVCTGPLFLPQYEPGGKLYVKYEVIGQNHVAVPTHFFKVVVIENNSGQLELQSYVMPNQALPPEVRVHHYLAPLDMIERSAGLNFFQNIPKGTFHKVNSPVPIKS